MTTANATMEQFFTRERANEGVDLPLFLPDGTPTKHTIKIRGVDSDIFRQTEAESSRRVMESGLDLKDQKKLVETILEAKADVIAALVISWTFDTPCTVENVKKLFKEAPQIQEQVDRLASKRSLFFKVGSLNSTPSPVQNLS